MLKEMFIGRPPSNFEVNPIVKAFIISETFLWSSWNSVTPIFAIFAATKIPGGSVEIAAFAFSAHLIVRVIFELVSGKILLGANDSKKFTMTIAGILLLSLSYLGFSQSNSVLPLFIFYGVSGMGLGIASPAKNSLFSMHLDKNKEATEWGIYDATVFMGMALSAALGGFIASAYGFSILFIIAMIINLLGIIPYLLYLRSYAR